MADGLYMIGEAEMRLLKRLRGLPAGAHLAIITTDGQGVATVTLTTIGRVERLRKAADEEVRDTNPTIE